MAIPQSAPQRTFDRTPVLRRRVRSAALQQRQHLRQLGLVMLQIGGIASLIYAFQYGEKSFSAWAPMMWPIKVVINIGLFLTLMFLFIRVLPMISIFEMRTLVPEAKVKGSEGH